MAKMITPIKIKITVSALLFITSVIAFIWRLAVPDILHHGTALSAVYFLLLLALTPLVIIIGWFGANLTFPIEKD